MTKRTITQEEYQTANRLLFAGKNAVKSAGAYCKTLIDLLDDVDPGETTDAVFGGHIDIDELLRKLGIAVEE